MQGRSCLHWLIPRAAFVRLYFLRTVRRYAARGSTLNRQLRGVSTKHLPNYLAWMRLGEWFKEGIKPEHFVVSGLGKQLINVPATS